MELNNHLNKPVPPGLRHVESKPGQITTLGQVICLAAVLGVASMSALADVPRDHDSNHPEQKPPLIIKEQGDFYIGGETVYRPHNLLSSDPTAPPGVLPGHVVINQMYVEYQIPAKRERPLPVIMVHGSWHTGKTYGSTPDGREGWGTYFVRQGFPTYIVDDPNRGRSGYDVSSLNQVRLGLEPVEAMPVISRVTNEFAWTTFRIGPEPGVPHPNTQFPIEAADEYFAQLIVMYRGADEDKKIVADLVALLDKIGPAILLTHSQSGPFGWAAATQRPELVKGIVSVEPIRLEEFERFGALTGVPVMIMTGDFVTRDSLTDEKLFIESLQGFGGNAKLIHLPDIGIHGNSHMMMLEENNVEVADVIIDWIVDNVDARRGRK